MKEKFALSLNDCFLIQTPSYADERGFFREWYWAEEFPYQIVQGNTSSSNSGVIRGLHLSVSKLGQAKWISCFSGEINDVIVDVRPDSSTFLQHEIIRLSAADGQILSIPPGIAHGFASLKDDTIVGYLVSSKFDPENEVGINPLDGELGIEWGVSNPIISDKDKFALSLSEFLVKYSASLRGFH